MLRTRPLSTLFHPLSCPSASPSTPIFLHISDHNEACLRLTLKHASSTTSVHLFSSTIMSIFSPFSLNFPAYFAPSGLAPLHLPSSPPSTPVHTPSRSPPSSILTPVHTRPHPVSLPPSSILTPVHTRPHPVSLPPSSILTPVHTRPHPVSLPPSSITHPSHPSRITPIPYHTHPASHPSRITPIPLHHHTSRPHQGPVNPRSTPPSSRLNENRSIGDAFGKKILNRFYLH